MRYPQMRAARIVRPMALISQTGSTTSGASLVVAVLRGGGRRDGFKDCDRDLGVGLAMMLSE